MSERIAGVVKAGETITLGWSYYQNREHILTALVDFDAGNDLAELRQRLIDDKQDDDTDELELEEFYPKVIERWTLLGYVTEVKIIHGFIGATVPSYGVSQFNVNEWRLVPDD